MVSISRPRTSSLASSRRLPGGLPIESGSSVSDRVAPCMRSVMQEETCEPAQTHRSGQPLPRTRSSQESRVCSSGADLRPGAFDLVVDQQSADDVRGVKWICGAAVTMEGAGMTAVLTGHQPSRRDTAMRVVWRGTISFGLVTIPGRLYGATEGKNSPSHRGPGRGGG